MPYDAAVTAWTNLMGCNEPSNPEALAAAVIAFRDEFLWPRPRARPALSPRAVFPSAQGPLRTRRLGGRID